MQLIRSRLTVLVDQRNKPTCTQINGNVRKQDPFILLPAENRAS
jgi:hypothetical protein